jgi:hypothetical protein
MLTAIVLAWAWAAPAVARPSLADGSQGRTVELRGRVVCLDEAGHTQPCREDSRRFGLQDAAGRLERFLETDPLAAIFQDAQVRERELLVRARPRPDETLEIVKVYSVKEGKLQDLHYFCEVCNITAYAPGPCPCCRREMELRETPVE